MWGAIDRRSRTSVATSGKPGPTILLKELSNDARSTLEPDTTASRSPLRYLMALCRETRGTIGSEDKSSLLPTRMANGGLTSISALAARTISVERSSSRPLGSWTIWRPSRLTQTFAMALLRKSNISPRRRCPLGHRGLHPHYLVQVRLPRAG